MNIREKVVGLIMDQLAQGVAPWRRPWFMLTKRNGHSGHEYRGINRLLLAHSSDAMFFTFNQARALGGSVKKNEHGHMVVFWKPRSVVESIGVDGEVEEVTIPIIKYYTVFGISQVDLPDDVREKIAAKWAPPAPLVGLSNENADQLLLNLGPVVRFNSAKAYYSPTEDFIGMPEAKWFESTEGYYNTLFHEVGHWTGHQSRCNRSLKNGFGSEQYAKEELVAEITSAMVCSDLGIALDVANDAAYIKTWMERIKDQPNIIFSASTHAEKAYKWIRDKVA